MLVLSDREHQARIEGTEAYAELKRIEVKSRAALDENKGLRDQICQLEQELAKSRASEGSVLQRVGELEGAVAEFEMSKVGIRAEVVNEFRRSQKYVDEVGLNVASKIHDTYLAVEKYFKDRLDGGFDDFVDFFLAEEEKSRNADEAAGSQAP